MSILMTFNEHDLAQLVWTNLMISLLALRNKPLKVVSMVMSDSAVTFDDEVGLSLEVFGDEFHLSGFTQLNVAQRQAVDLRLRLQHHLQHSQQLQGYFLFR